MLDVYGILANLNGAVGHVTTNAAIAGHTDRHRVYAEAALQAIGRVREQLDRLEAELLTTQQSEAA